MGYLICEKCGGSYQLKEGESIDDFEGCQCGGKFKYANSIDELNSIRSQIANSKESEDKSVCPYCGSKNDINIKFCRDCGKPLKNPISSDFDNNKKQSESGKPFYCPKCGTENIKTAKNCVSCSKSLINIPKKSKSKTNISYKPNKYRNKRTYSLFGIGIVIIAFLIIWLPTNVSANHYDDGYISFNYPSTWSNITPNTTATRELFNSSQFGGEITHYGGGDEENGFYNIQIGVIPMIQNIQVPINRTVNQTVGLDSNGNNITAPVNVSTGNFTNVTMNVLQNSLDNYTSLSGEQPDVYKKNGFTYYELGNITYEDFPEYNPIPDGAVYTTFIEKPGLPYFFYIGYELEQSSDNQTSTEGYNGYKQIVDSFRLG